MIVGRIGVGQGSCLVTLKMQPLRARLSHGCHMGGMTVSPRLILPRLFLQPGSGFNLVPALRPKPAKRRPGNFAGRRGSLPDPG
jgi:hypothetical protein